MRILFTSDLHLKPSGRRRLIAAVADPWHEVWLDTGDLLPNTNSLRNLDFATAQRQHQVRWMRHSMLARRLAAALAGRPAILLPGNHDFVGLAPSLAAAGARVLDPREPFEWGGERFAGFREVPFHRGRWVGEAQEDELAGAAARALAGRPSILVSHAPCRGVLDDISHALHTGVAALEQGLSQPDHGVRWHLHGHIHEAGGPAAFTWRTPFRSSHRHHMRIDTASGRVEVLSSSRSG